MKRISKDLLDIICCPTCKGDLKYFPDESRLHCKKCKVDYDVRDGVPILMPKEK